jgi:hypothetical protein
MTDQTLWGEINSKSWKQTPHIKNKVATEQDVKDGVAAFYIDKSPEDHEPLNIQIPALAYQKDDENILVVIIQGEKVNNEEVIGFRYIDGGNGICMLSELVLTTL